MLIRLGRGLRSAKTRLGRAVLATLLPVTVTPPSSTCTKGNSSLGPLLRLRPETCSIAQHPSGNIGRIVASRATSGGRCATRRRDWRRLTPAKRRRPPLRWCCLSAVAFAVGCGSTTTRAAHPLSASTTVRPWSQPVAPAVPETHRVRPGSLGRSSDCVATTAAQSPGRETLDGLVGADDRPSGAELSWLPGREDQRCEVLFTRADAKQAQQLVDDVNTAPVIPPGRPYNCLTTNDAEILVVFRYRTGFESLQVMLTGCAGISAPNRYSRFVTQRLRDDLRGLAPGRSLANR